MPFLTCRTCGMRVFVREMGPCPSCGAALSGSDSASPEPEVGHGKPAPSRNVDSSRLATTEEIDAHTRLKAAGLGGLPTLEKVEEDRPDTPLWRRQGFRRTLWVVFMLPFAFQLIDQLQNSPSAPVVIDILLAVIGAAGLIGLWATRKLEVRPDVYIRRKARNGE